MRHRIITTILSIFALANLSFAQNENEQVLIFRNTGEANLLYSNEIDSIVCSYIDKDSVLHEDYVSQIFYTRDTALIVPIAEIDSVAFGQRNVVKYKKDVRQLSQTDISYIIRYDGYAIYYKHNTPTEILPSTGDKLFYGEMDNIFPIGLCVKVTDVERLSNEIKVSVTDIELKEVFEQLFFAGNVTPIATVSTRSSDSRNTQIDILHTTHLGEHGSIDLAGHIDIAARYVVQPLRDYYHAKIVMESDLGFGIKALIEREFSDEDYITTVHFPNIASIIHPQMTIGAFAEINAELAFNYSMRREYHHVWEWTRKDGVNTFNNIANSESSKPVDKAQMDVTCNGNLYFGPQFVFELNTLCSTIGARAKIKIGPEVESEAGIGLIQSLSEEYNPELYDKAKLDIATKLQFSGHAFTRNLFYGEENEHTILKIYKKFGGFTLNLFPDFIKTRAVEMKRQDSNVTISTSTISENHIIRSVETGFQLENGTTQEVLEQTFVATIHAENTTKQGIDTLFTLAQAEYSPEETVVRPVFKYAELTILADKVNILTDNNIQPIVALMTNGVNTMLSGYPIIGSTVIDSTYYNIGNYLPVNITDTVFTNNNTIPTIGIYILPEEKTTLLGSWKGTVDEKETVITFNENATGHFEQENKITFKYMTNHPQTGDIFLEMEDSTYKVFTLYSLTENELILKVKKREEYYKFIKQ